MPDPAVTGENPYPSNSTGGFSATGTYRTYKAMVYHTSLRNNDNDQMGMRKATIIVSNGNTADAEVVSARFTTPSLNSPRPTGPTFAVSSLLPRSTVASSYAKVTPPNPVKLITWFTAGTVHPVLPLTGA
ncbi:MAG: hypothetical protein IPM37_06490 [Hahellaceae bacterium]|nr:hypothetical protein [Hahellaceae bacterium]